MMKKRSERIHYDFQQSELNDLFLSIQHSRFPAFIEGSQYFLLLEPILSQIFSLCVKDESGLLSPISSRDSSIYE